MFDKYKTIIRVIEAIQFTDKYKDRIFNSNALYRFSLSLCDELYKYTGDMANHEKLDRLVTDGSLNNQ